MNDKGFVGLCCENTLTCGQNVANIEGGYPRSGKFQFWTRSRNGYNFGTTDRGRYNNIDFFKRTFEL